MTHRLSDLVTREDIDRVTSPNGTLHRLPGVAFRSEEFLALEFRRWLSRTWLFVGRGADIPNPGDGTTVPGLPVFLVRGRDGKIRAFLNACRHRGHRILKEPCQAKRLFVCPYHSWSYDLEGRLVRTPHMAGADRHELEGLDKTDYGLKPVRCEQWHDWIFINLSGEAEPLKDFVAPIAERLSFVDFGRLKHFLTMSRRPIEANWKVCVENTMEPYHLPFVHAKTAAGQPLDQHYSISEDPIFGSGIEVPGSVYTNEHGAGGLDNLDMSAHYLLRAPNFFLTSYAPDVIVDTMYVPDQRDPRKCWLEQAWYTTSGREVTAAEIAEWESLEEAVMIEDVTVMAEVQAGAETAVVDDGGVLSPVWETCIHGFYRHLIERLDD
ncbi:MAG: SRPBCC family protein [Pseudomonadota bacterium]